jgi:hypothetical protein
MAHSYVSSVFHIVFKPNNACSSFARTINPDFHFYGWAAGPSDTRDDKAKTGFVSLVGFGQGDNHAYHDYHLLAYLDYQA